MSVDWARLSVAIVGGDRREQEIARLAAETGASVRAYGFPWPEGGIRGVELMPQAASALRGADVALFPIPGISADGALFAPQCGAPIILDRESLAGMRNPRTSFWGRRIRSSARTARPSASRCTNTNPTRGSCSCEGPRLRKGYSRC